MAHILVISIIIFFLAIVMSMTGRGGGNFYVPVLLVAGIPVHEASTISQLILVVTATAAMVVFQKNKTVDWKLALFIDPPADIMAFFGGYYAHQFLDIYKAPDNRFSYVDNRVSSTTQPSYRDNLYKKQVIAIYCTNEPL